MLEQTFISMAIALSVALAPLLPRCADDCQYAFASQQSEAQASKATKRATVDPNKFAIVIAGAGGEADYTKKFTAQAAQAYAALTNNLGFDTKNVHLLTELINAGPENAAHDTDAPAAKRATAEEVRKAFDSIKASAKADSLVIVMLIGHGSFDTQQAKFNLVGPDLGAKEFAQLMSALPTRRVVFVNCSSSSGEFIKPLSSENRIIITATKSGNEQNATIFAEHFVAGLTSSEADTDKNTRVSLLEAFDYATKMVGDWYKKQNRLATEHALLDDNGDGAGHDKAAEGDGALAKTTYLDSKTIEEARSDAELARLIAERERLEQEVEKLKAKKARMKEEDYERELETLLVELARVSQTIKARQK